MGPKYEFTGETKNYEGHILHRIKRLSDNVIGGWIEKEENLSQDGSCWVSNGAKVYDDARIYDNAAIWTYAQVYGNAKVYGNATIYDRAVVHDDAQVYGDANVYGKAKVYGEAKVYGNAKIDGETNVFGNIKITNEKYYTGDYFDEDDTPKEVVQDFIYKVDDLNEITAQIEYNSIDEFFVEPIKNDIKLDTLVICTVDTKEPLIKLQKVEIKDKIEFKFIVDITNEDGDDFIFRSIIKSQEQLNQLIQQTIDALKNYPQFSKYVNDLENCL